MAQHGYGVSRESHAQRGIVGPGLKLRSDGYDSKRHPVHDLGRGQRPRASSTVIVSSLYLRGTARPPKYGVATKGVLSFCSMPTKHPTDNLAYHSANNKEHRPTQIQTHMSHATPTPIPQQPHTTPTTIPTPRANPASNHAPTSIPTSIQHQSNINATLVLH